MLRINCAMRSSISEGKYSSNGAMLWTVPGQKFESYLKNADTLQELLDEEQNTATR